METSQDNLLQTSPSSCQSVAPNPKASSNSATTSTASLEVNSQHSEPSPSLEFGSLSSYTTETPKDQVLLQHYEQFLEKFLEDRNTDIIADFVEKFRCPPNGDIGGKSFTPGEIVKTIRVQGSCSGVYNWSVVAKGVGLSSKSAEKLKDWLSRNHIDAFVDFLCGVPHPFFSPPSFGINSENNEEAIEDDAMSSTSSDSSDVEYKDAGGTKPKRKVKQKKRMEPKEVKKKRLDRASDVTSLSPSNGIVESNVGLIRSDPNSGLDALAAAAAAESSKSNTETHHKNPTLPASNFQDTGNASRMQTPNHTKSGTPIVSRIYTGPQYGTSTPFIAAPSQNHYAPVWTTPSPRRMMVPVGYPTYSSQPVQIINPKMASMVGVNGPVMVSGIKPMIRSSPPEMQTSNEQPEEQTGIPLPSHPPQSSIPKPIIVGPAPVIRPANIKLPVMMSGPPPGGMMLPRGFRYAYPSHYVMKKPGTHHQENPQYYTVPKHIPIYVQNSPKHSVKRAQNEYPSPVESEFKTTLSNEIPPETVEDDNLMSMDQTMNKTSRTKTNATDNGQVAPPTVTDVPASPFKDMQSATEKVPHDANETAVDVLEDILCDTQKPAENNLDLGENSENQNVKPNIPLDEPTRQRDNEIKLLKIELKQKTNEVERLRALLAQKDAKIKEMGQIQEGIMTYVKKFSTATESNGQIHLVDGVEGSVAPSATL